MAVKRCSCPIIDPAEWEGKEFEWENKTFYFVPVNMLLYKPRNLEEKVRQLRKEVAEKDYKFTDLKPTLCEWAAFKGRLLSQIWNPQKYDESVYVFDMGTVYSTVFEGPAKDFKRAVTEFASQIQLNHSVPAQSIYVWYTHCKQCAKMKNNQAVIFIKT